MPFTSGDVAKDHLIDFTDSERSDSIKPILLPVLAVLSDAASSDPW